MASYDAAGNRLSCCRGCGREGLNITRHTCPSCPCNNCHGEGHSAAVCPAAATRNQDRQRERHASVPVKPVLGRSGVPSPAIPTAHTLSTINTSGQPPAKKRRPNPSLSKAHSKSGIKPRAEVEFSDVEKERAAKAVDIHQTSSLPRFDILAKHLLQHLCSDTCPAVFTHYKLQLDGIDSSKLCEDLISAIDPQIRALEGQEIDRDSLQGVKESQKDDPVLFECDGGYMDYITDTRNHEYFRMYIGQGQAIKVRVSEHKESIAWGDITSLHYYILTGGQFRTTNFIRLYRLLPNSFLIKKNMRNEKVEQLNEVRRTLLELLMTLAFQTLPATELQQWLPMINKGGVVHNDRQSSREQLRLSQDPQLASWPDVRAQQIRDRKKQQSSNLGSYPKLYQMGDIVRAAIEDNRTTLGQFDTVQFPIKPPIDQHEKSSIEDRLRQLRTDLSDTSLLDKIYRPVGSLDSPISMVLNRALLPKHDRPNSQESFLPVAFVEMGLTDGQTLIWPFDLRNRSGNTPEVISGQANREATAFKNFSLGLLKDSRASFILITEGAAEESLFQDNPLLSAEFKGTLRSYEVRARLFVRGGKIQKVFMVIPDPESLYSRGNWRSCQRFTHNLRMAAFLSGARRAKWKLFEHRSAHAMILRAYAAKDMEMVSLNTLDHFIVDWLYRKGFRTAEDAQELQDLSPIKSLPDACFMSMVLLPKQTKHGINDVDRAVLQVRETRSRGSDPRCSSPRKIAPEDANAVRQLYQKKLHIMLADDPDYPNLPGWPNPHNSNRVMSPADNEHGEASSGPTEADMVDIMTMLQDDSVPVVFNTSRLPMPQVDYSQQPRYPHRVTNPTGDGADAHWDEIREETANSILTGED
ncbi:hypothetical protein Z517_11955 [Fonsecaea pedrosoi CBS 271.37]|uniref:Uncharacterized protein n=1 Tax=Fonsecaea pedrosoi CBS 271.37 TaxID=1442368 RepID=A0A0D2EL84_9EURO|nr:uncharacterized protein Z517_11955 [Fonsecaea pedrosoi CBS 271.37]KIW75182.1 hypothetical protein Z517_11955 [Fonsecaea pedrosoi CBS 271.37]